MPLRILVVDDHALMIRGVRDVFEGVYGMQVVGEASSGPQALSMVARTRPDVVLMDVHLPGLDGMTCLERIGRDHPNVKVLMCSASTEPTQIAAAFRLGAIVAKSVNPVDLPAAIRQSCDGSVYHPFGLDTANCASNGLNLTEREQTILLAVAGGLSNKAIAAKLWVTEQTVKFHLTDVYRKLGVNNRTAAVHVAREHGVVSCRGAPESAPF